MASDKKKTVYTLADKCKDEDDKLRKELANQLKSDLKRLFTDRILSDLIIKAEGKKYHIHKIIFQDMGCDIYSDMMSLPESSEKESLVVLNSAPSPEELKEILGLFYTDDDISSAVKKLKKYLLFEQPPLPDHISESSEDTGRLYNGNINDNCLNRTDKELNSLDNGVTKKLEELAERFVKQIIEEAQKTCSSEGSCILVPQNCFENVSVDRLGENSGADGTGMTVDTSSTSSTNRTLDHTETSNNIDTIADTAEYKVVNSSSTKSGVQNTVYSRIPSSESSVGEIVKKELNLKMAPKACSVLGEDLMRKLAKGVASDCVVSVGDWEFPAHRCMLAARSSYFAMMLNGSWMESESEKIMLEGVDAGVVKQMLLYIYGGVLDLDPACSIGGLVMVADMYDVTGMKNIVSLALNKDYCHFFHKPCPGCIAGVPETLPLTMMYNMKEMCEKCLRWINKHKEKVWPTKGFALLPQECLDFCSAGAVKELNIINIIESLLECQRLNEKIPRLKWTDSVLNCVATVMDAALEFASQNFVNIVSGQEFKRLDGKSLGFNLRSLEEIFTLVVTSLAPGVACQSYLSLHTLQTQIQKYIKAQEERNLFKYDRFSEEYTSLVEKLCKKCKEQLCLYIHQAVNTTEWFLLSQELQKEIMDEANYVCIDSPGRGKMAARPKLTSMKKKPLSSEFRVSMKEYFDKHFGPKETFPAEAMTLQKSKVPKKVEKLKKTDSSTTKKEIQKKPASQTAVPKVGQKSKASTQVGEKRIEAKSSVSVKAKSLDKLPNQASSTALHDKTVMKSTSDVKFSKSKKGDKETSGKGTKSQTNSMVDTRSSSKSVTSRSTEHERAIRQENYSLFAKIKQEAAASANNTSSHTSSSNVASHIEESAESKLGGASPHKETTSRRRLHSAGSSAFQPHFGVAPRIQSAQSVDSFFSTERPGQATVLPRPVPSLNVNFAVPHEFYEQF